MNNLRTPPKFLQKPSPLFFHGAFAPSFTWRRRPCIVLQCSVTLDGLLEVRKPSSSRSIMPASDVSLLVSTHTSNTMNATRPTTMLRQIDLHTVDKSVEPRIQCVEALGRIIIRGPYPPSNADFCGGPLVVEALGNCPVCPLPLNPALLVPRLSTYDAARSRTSSTCSYRSSPGTFLLGRKPGQIQVTLHTGWL